MHINTALKTTRPPFLILTPVCVFIGFSTSLVTSSPINIVDFFIVLIGALFAHISVNTLNEYYDYKSGLDFNTIKTPFSGGSGALPGNPEIAELILYLGLVSLLVTVIIGFYFVLKQGIQILPIGIVGVLLIVTYTHWLNRVPLLCLIAPGLGFGVLMVVGTHIVIAGVDSQLPWLVAPVPFFLINNLLLLNQYPDIKADADVGRKTFPIAFGLIKSNFVYAVFMVAAYSWIMFLVVNGYIAKLCIVALIPMVFSILSLIGVMKYSSKISDYPRYMAANVAAAILTPLFLGISIISG